MKLHSFAHRMQIWEPKGTVWGNKRQKTLKQIKTTERKIKTSKRRVRQKTPHQTKHYIHRKTKHQKLKTKKLMEYSYVATGPALESGWKIESTRQTRTQECSSCKSFSQVWHLGWSMETWPLGGIMSTLQFMYNTCFPPGSLEFGDMLDRGCFHDQSQTESLGSVLGL